MTNRLQIFKKNIIESLFVVADVIELMEVILLFYIGIFYELYQYYQSITTFFKCVIRIT